jgi:hypothetical protein
MDQARQGLLRWVTEEKRLETQPGGRDEGLSRTEIAERLEMILFSPEANASTALRDARTGLSRAIGEWWAEQGGADRLPAGQLRGWAAAVLQGWRSLLREQLPAVLGQELDKLWARSHTELL